MLQLQLNSFSFELGAEDQNKVYPFIATVTFGGKPSDGFVGGTELLGGGPYRVRIPSDLLARKISELVNKNVFARDGLDGHANSERVGQFMQTWTEKFGDEASGLLAAKASGIIYSQRSKELVKTLIAETRLGKTGFSYDIKDVKYSVADLQTEGPDGLKAAEKILDLTDFQWRGATILRREAAAYRETALAASKLAEDSNMEKQEMQDLLTAALKPVTDSVATIVKDVSDLKTKQTALEGSVTTLQAAAKGGDDDKSKSQSQNDGGNKVTVAALAESIKTAVEAAMKPVVDALAAQRTEDKKGAPGRRTWTAGEVAFFGKFSDKKEGDELTASDLKTIMEKVQDDPHLSRDRKLAMLQPLGAARRELIKAAFRAGATGGVQ